MTAHPPISPRPLPRREHIQSLADLLVDHECSSDWAFRLEGGWRLAHVSSGSPGDPGCMSLSAEVWPSDYGKGLLRVVEGWPVEATPTTARDGVDWMLSQVTIEAMGDRGDQYHWTSGLEQLTPYWYAKFSSTRPLFAERSASLVEVMLVVLAGMGQLVIGEMMDNDSYKWLTPECERTGSAN